MLRATFSAAFVAGFVVAVGATAAESTRVIVAATETDTGATIEIQAPPGESAPQTSASVTGGVMTVRFSAPVVADVSALAAAAPRTIAAAKAASDGLSLSISLRRALKPETTTTSAGVKIILTPASAPTPATAQAATEAKPATTAELSIGQRPDQTRLSFLFAAGATSVTTARTGDRLELRFSRAAEIDLSRLRTAPPAFVLGASRPANASGRLVFSLDLEDGVRVRTYSDGARAVVDLLPPTPGDPDTAPDPAAVRDPMPKSGVAPVVVSKKGDETKLTVSWAGPARAAAFQRGDAVWLLFDSKAKLELQGDRITATTVKGDNLTGLRIDARPDWSLSAVAKGDVWEFTMSPRRAKTPFAAVTRDVGVAGRGRMSIDFAREGVVKRIVDPIVGDRMDVALLAGPAIGVETRRSTPEAAVLSSAHGAAVEVRAEGIGVAFDAGKLVIARGAARIARGELEAVTPLTSMTLLDVRREAATPFDAVLDRKDELSRKAATEGFEDGARPEARLALARFLLAHELAAEALGALRNAAVHNEQLEADPSFRLMRAAANLMVGRNNQARADLGASTLDGDPGAALWRGYLAAQDGNWAEARRQIERGRPALRTQPPGWRGRFELALAQSLAELDAFDDAAAAAHRAIDHGPLTVVGAAQIVQARVAAAEGGEKQALHALRSLQNSRIEEVSVRAAYETARVERAMGAAQADTLERLEALRLRWRGDALELAITQQLGALYAQLGRWREALVVLRSGAARHPGHPLGRQMRIDMSDLFERLFLDGAADELEPIQALGLFYDFKDLTPVGPNGDRIVRNLSARLVALDLLEQAAALLQHQVDTRLDGLGKAQVAADLALIYLQDRKPEKALSALSTSRQSNLPARLLADRRILEAKAQLDLGRTENALELLERDKSLEAQQIRAEAAWRARDWPKAAAELERVLALSASGGALDASDRSAIMRAAAARLFAADEAGLTALKDRFGTRMAETPDAAAFELVTSRPDASGGEIAQVARAIAQTELLTRFMDTLKARMTRNAAQSPPA
jgi:tetratricopeptide (TPR) repeat protein